MAAVKTGTLRYTDGGVAALAGYFTNPERGLVLFCVAAPHAGSRIQSWRSLEQQWLLGLISELGGATPDDCGPEVSTPDALATVEAMVPSTQAGPLTLPGPDGDGKPSAASPPVAHLALPGTTRNDARGR